MQQNPPPLNPTNDLQEGLSSTVSFTVSFTFFSRIFFRKSSLSLLTYCILESLITYLLAAFKQKAYMSLY